MPTNLNALIRYKQIDACLKNKYVKCTIDRLQEVCSAAMGEFRGKYKLVSERTIRDDIRVMRSNILGFNAPIEFEDGRYFYSDDEYSIFNTPVTEVDLLKDILKMLLEERNNIADSEIDRLLQRISIIVGEPLPIEIEEESTGNIIIRSSEYRISYSMETEKPRDENFMELPDSVKKNYSRRSNFIKATDRLIFWNEILSIFE